MTAAVTIREILRGHITFGANDCLEGRRLGKVTGTELDLELDVSINDTERFVSVEQTASVSGDIVCVALGGRIPIDHGTMSVVNFGIAGCEHHIRYRLVGCASSGEEVIVTGNKELIDDPGRDMAKDLATLFVEVQVGERSRGTVAKGVVVGKKGELFQELRNVRGDAASVYRFGQALFGELWRIYGERQYR